MQRESSNRAQTAIFQNCTQTQGSDIAHASLQYISAHFSGVAPSTVPRGAPHRGAPRWRSAFRPLARGSASQRLSSRRRNAFFLCLGVFSKNCRMSSLRALALHAPCFLQEQAACKARALSLLICPVSWPLASCTATVSLATVRGAIPQGASSRPR